MAFEEFGSELRSAIIRGESGAAAGDDDTGSIGLRGVDEKSPQCFSDGFAVADDDGVGGLIAATAQPIDEDRTCRVRGLALAAEVEAMMTAALRPAPRSSLFSSLTYLPSSQVNCSRAQRTRFMRSRARHSHCLHCPTPIGDGQRLHSSWQH